jgi:hypothetical protein
MVTVIFIVAVFYASVCSASCAIGVCPDQVQRTAGHDCDQMPSHHSAPTKQQSPANRDCSEHQHPGLFVTKSNSSQFQLGIVDHLDASAATLSSARVLPTLFAHSATSEHAPPIVSSAPLYDLISVLRI